MATSKKETNTSNENLEERGVKALESIASSMGDMNEWFYDLDADLWQERFEWYLNEFYQIAKAKTVGTTNRPERESERIEKKEKGTDSNS
tara:strand:+ start:487 stop:756 length:270 start_codon:yes stop_codon:yes gene_type:complete